MDTGPIFEFIELLEDLHGNSQKSFRMLEERFESCLFQCVVESPATRAELPIIEQRIQKAYEKICSINEVKLNPEHEARLHGQRIFAKKALDCLHQYIPSATSRGAAPDLPAEKPLKEDTPNNNAGVAKKEDTGWYNTKEVSEKYKIPYNNVKDRKWREEKGFPTHQSGGAYSKVSFNAAEVEEWLSKH